MRPEHGATDAEERIFQEANSQIEERTRAQIVKGTRVDVSRKRSTRLNSAGWRNYRTRSLGHQIASLSAGLRRRSNFRAGRRRRIGCQLNRYNRKRALAAIGKTPTLSAQYVGSHGRSPVGGPYVKSGERVTCPYWGIARLRRGNNDYPAGIRGGTFPKRSVQRRSAKSQ